MVRPVPLVLGLVSLFVGLALTAAGGDVLPVKWLQDLALLVAAIAVAGVAIVGLLVRSLADGGEGSLPDPRAGRGGRTPGDAVDAAIAEATEGSEGARVDVRNRFEAAAVAVVRDRRGCSAEEARRLIEEGAWTRDDAAAAFFDDGGRSRTLLGWLRGLVGDGPDVAERADRASRELLRIADGREPLPPEATGGAAPDDDGPAPEEAKT